MTVFNVPNFLAVCTCSTYMCFNLTINLYNVDGFCDPENEKKKKKRKKS